MRPEAGFEGPKASVRRVCKERKRETAASSYSLLQQNDPESAETGQGSYWDRKCTRNVGGEKKITKGGTRGHLLIATEKPKTRFEKDRLEGWIT